MKQARNLVIIIAVIMAAIACSNMQIADDNKIASQTSKGPQTFVEPENGQTLDVESQSSVEPSAVPSPDELPLTTAPTGLPTPTLPFSADADFLLRKALFGGSSDCTLPCWYGIVPGQSTEGEADAAVLSNLGIDIAEAPRYDFGILASTSDDLAQRYYLKGYDWYTGETDSDAAFYVSVGIDRSTQEVALVRLRWSMRNSSRYKVSLSPEDVIRELGEPAFMGVHMATSGRSDYGEFGLLLVYPQGVVFQFYYGSTTFPTTPTDNPAIQDTHVEICLGTEETEPVTNVGYIVGDVFLMQPFSSDLENLTPVQASVISDLIGFYQYAPVDEVFGVTPQAIAAQAASGSDVCLNTIINH